MQATCPPDSSMIKDKLVQMQRECGGVGFLCANYQQFSSSHIWDHLLSSSSFGLNPLSPSKTGLQFIGDQHLEATYSLMNAWKSSILCSRPFTFQRTARMWLNGSLCLITCEHLRPTIFQNLVDEQPTRKLTLTNHHDSIIFDFEKSQQQHGRLLLKSPITFANPRKL